MAHKPPLPVCRTFLVCSQVYQDRRTGEFVLIAPMEQITAFAYPTIAVLAIFGRCTSFNGTYRLEARLQDLEGNVVWQHGFDPPLEFYNPLGLCSVNLSPLHVYFPGPGKYEMVLLANGDEIARDILAAALATAQTSPPPNP